jgi:aryl-alcohol dehydrogenase-like predicted oxidoreductase
VLSVKFGVLRSPSGEILGLDGRPAAVKNALGYTLTRLGTDYVDVYRLGRLDPAVPIEETVGAVAELAEAGYVRHLGLSEAGPETIRRAHGTHPVGDLQIEYSLVSRGIEGEILPTCRELGIGITAYGVLSRGLISGHWSPHRPLAPGDFRGGMPRFSGENLDRNLALVEQLRAVADAKGTTVAQLAIAWVLSRGEDIVPLVGARRRDRLREALGALEIELTADEVAVIERAVPREGRGGRSLRREADGDPRQRARRQLTKPLFRGGSACSRARAWGCARTKRKSRASRQSRHAVIAPSRC